MKLNMKLKRWFYKTKARLHILTRNFLEKFFKLLAQLNLVVEHKKKYVNFLDNSEPKPLPDIESDRYIFSVSYIDRKVEYVNQYWFESKRGKKLFVMWDDRSLEAIVSHRAELKSFYVHFSPKFRRWVNREHNRVALFKNSLTHAVLSEDDFATKVEVETHTCDFSECRYALEFRYALDSNTKETPSEVISKSYEALKSGMPSKVTEINKILTGVDYDGEIVSPQKTPLSENLLCRKCGLPVFASAERKYHFMCLKHGELDYNEVDRVDPIRYNDVYRNTLDLLEDLIHESECPAGLQPLG